jgi:hypothetical protein
MIHATCVLLLSTCFGFASLRADEARLTTVEGKYIRLATDLPPSEDFQNYVQAFDQAVPLWIKHWNRDLASAAGWRVTAYLMSDKSVFVRRGLIPSSLPDFLHGYQSGDKLWVVHQRSAFYTLHLLLHEGSHSLAHRLFGGAGPPWYMEGTAEFLATHEMTNANNPASLRIGMIPASREVSPYWGRIGLIADRRAEGKVPSIETVMRYGDAAHRDVEPYAWSWAAAVLMEMYPEYQKPFRAAALQGRDTSPEFTRQFFQSLRKQWPVLSARWQLLCLDLDYGFDRDANRIDLPETLPLFTGSPLAMELSVNQGWQSAPAMIRARQSVMVEAEGQFLLRDDEAWVSEADGVTITYHQGRPLGQLVACVVPRIQNATPYAPKLDVVGIGAKGKIISPADGWLIFKVNESPSDIADNQGTLQLSLSLSLP